MHVRTNSIVLSRNGRLLRTRAHCHRHDTHRNDSQRRHALTGGRPTNESHSATSTSVLHGDSPFAVGRVHNSLCTCCFAGSAASSPVPRRGCRRGCASPEGWHRSTSSRQASVPSLRRAEFSALSADGAELSALESDGAELSAMDRGFRHVSAATIGKPLH